MSQDYMITNDEVNHVFNLLDAEYDINAILLIHTAFLFVPRLIHMNYLPRHLFKSFFEFTSKEIAIACRIMLLDKYGMLFDVLLKDWGISSYKDINKIILAIDNLESVKELTKGIQKTWFDDSLIKRNAKLDKDSFEEIKLAHDILVAAADTSYVIESKEELPKKIYKKGWFELFKDFVCRTLRIRKE